MDPNYDYTSGAPTSAQISAAESWGTKQADTAIQQYDSSTYNPYISQPTLFMDIEVGEGWEGKLPQTVGLRVTLAMRPKITTTTPLSSIVTRSTHSTTRSTLISSSLRLGCTPTQLTGGHGLAAIQACLMHTNGRTWTRRRLRRPARIVPSLSAGLKPTRSGSAAYRQVDHKLWRGSGRRQYTLQTKSMILIK